jgi:hypothetical protein
MGKLSILRLTVAVTIFGMFFLPPAESFAAKNWFEKLFSSPPHKAPKRRQRPARTSVATPLVAPVPAAKPEPLVDGDAPPQSSDGIPPPKENSLASTPSVMPVDRQQRPPLPQSNTANTSLPGQIDQGDSDATLPMHVPIPEPNPQIAKGKSYETALAKETEPSDILPEPMLPDPRMADRPAQSGVLPAEEVACRSRLQSLGVKFENHGAESDPAGCSIPYPLTLTSLGSEIRIRPPAEMNCAMAEAAAHFMNDVVSPTAVAEFGQSLKSVSHASAYVCRSRNGTNKLSEHAFGNALDIASFTLSGGTTIAVEMQPDDKPAAFLQTVRKAACGPFKTVLGPGDPDHSEHFHFDLAARRHGGTVCE